MINIDDLKYKHKCNCKSKDSRNIVKSDVVYDKDIHAEVEYVAHCAECGAYLYYFSYGYIDT